MKAAMLVPRVTADPAANLDRVEQMTTDATRSGLQLVCTACGLGHLQTAVADNAVSLAQAAYSDGAWVRAIYADSDLVGFIMLHLGSDYDDGIDCPGVFLWRLMIARPFQGKGYGARAVHRLLAHLRSMGVRELYTCCETGPAGPEGFYRRLGFEPTGDCYGDQPEYVLRLDE